MGSPVTVVGSGPAGLMAAEVLSAAGHQVTILEHKKSPARKFLLAGRGGLNLTHSEQADKFLPRYGEAQEFLTPLIKAFPPDALIKWCQGLGQETFVGSSGRVFPKSMKASPLLRAWLRRLEVQGVRLALGQRWLGFDTAKNCAMIKTRRFKNGFVNSETIRPKMRLRPMTRARACVLG